MKYSFPIYLIIVCLSLTLARYENARAEGDTAESNCGITCPDGQKVVSFTDGNNATCVCHLETQMDPTMQDPEDVDTGEYEDEGQKE